MKQGASGRKELREQGVKQYNIGGKLSESFEDAHIPRLLSKKAREKLRFWMAGIASLAACRMLAATLDTPPAAVLTASACWASVAARFEPGAVR